MAVRLATKSSLAVLVRLACVVHFGHLSLRLAADLQVARVTEESIRADARGSMAIGHAQSIRSALDLGAGVDALAQTLAQLEADLRVLAVGVVAALAAYTASLDEIVRVSNVAHGADAFTGIANGSGTTSCLGAQVLALALLTAVAIWALDSLVALALVGVLAELALDRLAAAVWVSGMTGQTETLESSGRV